MKKNVNTKQAGAVKKKPHPTRIFKTPDELLKAWEGYKAHREKEGDRWLRIQYVGKNGDRKTDAPIMPYTFEGFKIYCRSKYGCVEQYFRNQDDNFGDFITICSHIKEEIRDNQITGGMLGYFNPSITQRLNNLSETTEVKTSVEVPLFPKE